MLSSCSLLAPKPTVISRPDIIEVPKLAYVPLPLALTAPVAPPHKPEARCEFKGKPAICVLDALMTIPEFRAAIDAANHDRAAAALLGKTDGAQ